MNDETSAALLSSPRRPGLPSDDSKSTLLPQQKSVLKWPSIAPKYQGQGKDARIGARSPYLQPFFLAALVALFLAFIATLEALKYVSNQRQGFVPSDEGKHYLWTYGPTLGEMEPFINGAVLTRNST